MGDPISRCAFCGLHFDIRREYGGDSGSRLVAVTWHHGLDQPADIRGVEDRPCPKSRRTDGRHLAL